MRLWINLWSLFIPTSSDEHIYFLNGIHASFTGLEMVVTTTLVGHHLLNEFHHLANGQGEKGSSSSGINMVMGWYYSQPVVEILHKKPIIHSVVRACQVVLLEVLPCFKNQLIWRLLKTTIPWRALVFPIRKNFTRNALEHLSHVSTTPRFT